jgi:hypothetical protein
MEPPSGHVRNSIGVVDSSGDVELTFLGYPFESLGRIFNSILTVITVGRKQPDHLISAAGGRTGDIAGSKIDSFSNGIFVLQRPLHHAKTPAMPTVPLQRPTENPGAAYITGPITLASYIRT